ncbi:MAG TPA: EAL domain-containing protein [Beijerinckiaceae bacterium]|nr:EAL domain-containing protein [Beijerinckiaceae bacterium]
MNDLHIQLKRQIARATAPNGVLDIVRLTQMINEAYLEADKERRRTDHSIRQMVSELDHRAQHDVLTNLANRSYFSSWLRQAIGSVTDLARIAVFFLDLDRFKEVNDTLGHPAGDELLRSVAARLSEAVGEKGLVARLGGDEFAVALPLDAGTVTPAELASRIIHWMSEPFLIEGQLTSIGVSIGICLFPDNGSGPTDLLRCADMALYRAKHAGKGTFCFFEDEMSRTARYQKAMEEGLREALERGSFELYFQPIVEAATMRNRTLETLLRWHHPTRGLITPSDFIPVAETTGLIVPIGEWVIRNACLQARAFDPAVSVAINLSPAQLGSENIVRVFEDALSESGVAASRIEIEITETVLMREDIQTRNVLQRLRQIGLRFSLDDFGTGYSSLGYLQKFHFDKIKIDRSFCASVNSNPVNAALVRAIAGLGRDLGIAVVAEGIETAQQSAALAAEGCQYLQGYFHGRPAPAMDFVSNLDGAASMATRLRDTLRPPARELAAAS